MGDGSDTDLNLYVAHLRYLGGGNFGGKYEIVLWNSNYS
jgi:hypothetical protein